MAVPRVIREEIEAQMVERRLSARFHTFPSALAEISDAAYNRRMTVRDFVGRAALAFAVYDSEGEVVWDEITEKEPNMTDLVRPGFDRDRLRGGGHGKWQIVRLR
jgi:hypothetical protein